jgi:hypothetical protein
MKQSPLARLAALAVLTAATVVSLGITSGDVASAGSCSYRSDIRPWDSRTGRTWSGVWVCGSYASLIWRYDGGSSENNVGSMYASKSNWVVCWANGDYHDGQNYIWYYTQGDTQTAVGGWGFQPANFVWTSTDPWPGMGRCPWDWNGYQTSP